MHKQLFPQPNIELLSRVQAAEYLGVSPRTRAVWRSTGRHSLPAIKVGRLAKYSTAHLDAFIARNTVCSNVPAGADPHPK